MAIFSVACAGLLSTRFARAAQVDIAGPPGSVAFGSAVAVLPNGNIVVTDPNWSSGTLSNVGAVYLYNPKGTLIASFTGSAEGDRVGGQITVLTNGNFVIGSPGWDNGAVVGTGAVTWVDGNAGLSGVVSAANSLVGTTAGDSLGTENGVIALSTGNYVVLSPDWSNGTATSAGAVTWANGDSGLSGPVSSSNSLVGTTAGDRIGSTSSPDIDVAGRIRLLSNGNFVVASPYWTNGSIAAAGAVTWVNGNTGMSGAVSSANSLVGTTANDQVGVDGAVALTNGNYVVKSPLWNNGAAAQAGAVTWANGSTGSSGVVSAANSLVGTTANDHVGADTNYAAGVTALSNGNYVVASSDWHNGASASAGAATWANGNAGLSGPLSAGNSLVGTLTDDEVALAGVVALSNGNYVVASPVWANAGIANAGAATWANGTTGESGPVSATNSLVGSTAGDYVGTQVVELTNGNYVVSSPYWSNGGIADVGAVTWANGGAGLSGPVSSANSLVGASPNDGVGIAGVIALSNGNYVVASSAWNNGAAAQAGAVTWANGAIGASGTVAAGNSLVGTSAFGYVGNGGIAALDNGNYVVLSSSWYSSASLNSGAVTWLNGSSAFSGVVSAANSLVGGWQDSFAGGEVVSLSRGNYAVVNPEWSDNGVTWVAGAISEGRGTGGLAGPILATNSVLGTTANGGYYMVFAYDAARDQLAVGQPSSNIVSLFKADLLFTNGFE